MPSGAPAPSDQAAGRIGSAATNARPLVMHFSLKRRFDPSVPAASGSGLPAATIGPCVDDGVHGLDAVGRGIRTATGANRQIVIEITSITGIFVDNAALRRIQTIAYDAPGPEYPDRRRMARETPDAMNPQVEIPVCATMAVWSARVVPCECRS